ncbi:hypothetical protein AVEN_114336-1 [Araneus ventricosus]|uniref:Uncharacterized protein n=1 Tax=Araneus ventricosus TaxID=182803 RepID=A0A4Y2HPI4_ARAVE|nr:hypothetical protein AVEN_114336-1 [Araneus ventricosus]
MEAPDCEVQDVSEHENHTSEESATSDYDENIVTQTAHNVQHIQSKHQNMHCSLDVPPRSGCLNSANFMKTVLSVTRAVSIKSQKEHAKLVEVLYAAFKRGIPIIWNTIDKEFLIPYLEEPSEADRGQRHGQTKKMKVIVTII